MIFKKSQLNQALEFVKQHIQQSNIEIKPDKQKKTLSQNAYIWLLCTHIGYETGNTKETIYHYCLDKFAPLNTCFIGDIEYPDRITLSGFSKEQAMIFINNILSEFQEYDLPNPEDIKCLQMYEFYKEKGYL
jgi:hypothetical protein